MSSCISCHVKNFYYFLGDSLIFGDSFFHYHFDYHRQLQAPIMVFNEKALVNISKPSEFSTLKLLLMIVSETVCEIVSGLL